MLFSLMHLFFIMVQLSWKPKPKNIIFYCTPDLNSYDPGEMFWPNLEIFRISHKTQSKSLWAPLSCFCMLVFIHCWILFQVIFLGCHWRWWLHLSDQTFPMKNLTTAALYHSRDQGPMLARANFQCLTWNFTSCLTYLGHIHCTTESQGHFEKLKLRIFFWRFHFLWVKVFNYG